MSEGIQKAAGNQLQRTLKAMTKNRFVGLLTGIFTTATVQSSSATTVMTVSFVNAGLLSLQQSAGVMMGANIGTTITAWIIASQFELTGNQDNMLLSMSTLSLLLIAIGVPMIFRNIGKLRYWGEFLIGFAIIFLAISFLQEAVPDIKSDPDLALLEWVREYSDRGFVSILLFVLMGTILTIVLQSSSAAMVLTLTMCSKGWLSFEVAAAMVLGENIGTTLTAEVASLVGNTDARRSARIHSFFNIFGVFWVLLLFPFFLDIVTWISMNIFQQPNPYENASGIDISLSVFHSAFNIINALILLPFLGILIALAKRSVRQSAEDLDDFQLNHIASNFSTPELALNEVQNETLRLVDVVTKMNNLCRELINSVVKKKKQTLLKGIKRYEKLSDKLEGEIVSFITKLGREQMSEETSYTLRSYINICNDLEIICDIYFQISKEIEYKSDNKIWFTPEQRDGINGLIVNIDAAIEQMKTNLKAIEITENLKSDAKKIEVDIDNLEQSLRSENIRSVNLDETNIDGVMIFNNLVYEYEKISNLIYAVTKHLYGK